MGPRAPPGLPAPGRVQGAHRSAGRRYSGPAGGRQGGRLPVKPRRRGLTRRPQRRPAPPRSWPRPKSRRSLPARSKVPRRPRQSQPPSTVRFRRGKIRLPGPPRARPPRPGGLPPPAATLPALGRGDGGPAPGPRAGAGPMPRPGGSPARPAAASRTTERSLTSGTKAAIPSSVPFSTTSAKRSPFNKD
jgi:hypothetical protein